MDMALSPAEKRELLRLRALDSGCVEEYGYGLVGQSGKRLKALNGRVVAATRAIAFGTPTKSAAAAPGMPGRSGVGTGGQKPAPTGKRLASRNPPGA